MIAIDLLLKNNPELVYLAIGLIVGLYIGGILGIEAGNNSVKKRILRKSGALEGVSMRGSGRIKIPVVFHMNNGKIKKFTVRSDWTSSREKEKMAT